MRKIKPQQGFQTEYLKTPADIAIGGGAAGAGKTFALLLNPLRYITMIKGFGGVIFRRTSPQIRNEGGLWDTSQELYSLAGGEPKESTLEWIFAYGNRLKFNHLEHEKNIHDHQGAQYPFIGFDELTHFSKKQFFYLLSRNRSVCGIKPYIRATCNPDPNSWVYELIKWWINEETGFPIPERAGKLRYFVNNGEDIIWGNNKQEVIEKSGHIINALLTIDSDIDPKDLVKSLTFIPGNIHQNKILVKNDPGYYANLLSQDEITKLQLLEGNWKFSNDGTELINPIKLMDSFSNEFVEKGIKCITADIALKGSDLLVIGVWDGWRLIDIYTMEVAKGDDIIDLLKKVSKEYRIPQSMIIYDDDGAGSFIDGFIKTARAFNNGSKALHSENYNNLKSQCYFHLAEEINGDGFYIAPDVAKKIVGGKSVKDHILEERRAIKRDKVDYDGKLCIVQKQDMKGIIGHSPDFFDMIMMRKWFDLKKIKQSTGKLSKGKLGIR